MWRQNNDSITDVFQDLSKKIKERHSGSLKVAQLHKSEEESKSSFTQKEMQKVYNHFRWK